jgi:hypothetical protein
LEGVVTGKKRLITAFSLVISQLSHVARSLSIRYPMFDRVEFLNAGYSQTNAADYPHAG